MSIIRMMLLAILPRRRCIVHHPKKKALSGETKIGIATHDTQTAYNGHHRKLPFWIR